jgi:hypothetical protein
MKTRSVKWIVTLAMMLVLLGLGLLKGSWNSASAGSHPTIPTIPGTEVPTYKFLIAPTTSENYTCGSLPFPANISVTIRVCVPPAPVARYLVVTNPADYLSRQDFSIFNILGEPFDVKMYAADLVTELHDFNRPLLFQMFYQDHDLIPGWTEGDLQFYSQAGGTWTWDSIGTAVDKNANILTAYIAHLSTSYAVFDAKFQLRLPVVSR